MLKSLGSSKLIILVLLLSILVANGSLVVAQPGVEAEPQPLEEEPIGEAPDYNYYRGRVIIVEDFETEGRMATVEQRAQVRITSGPHQGETVAVKNQYNQDNPYLNIYLEEGSEVILVADEVGGELRDVHLQDVARDRGLFYLLGVFVLLLLIIGKVQGLKTVITLAFTALVIVKFMLPSLLGGSEPILIAIIGAIIIIIPTLFVIGGFNAKSIAAIIGTACGVVVAGLLAFWVGEVSHLTGFSSEEAQMLSRLGHDIDVRGLLFAGIIIGSLGAVTDVSMSVASAIYEIGRNRAQVELRPLIGAGMNVGRDIMGTMANTLLLAYVGGAIPLLLLLMGSDIAWLRIINMDLMVTEFVRGITGSIGLIISIPITAVIAGILVNNQHS